MTIRTQLAVTLRESDTHHHRVELGSGLSTQVSQHLGAESRLEATFWDVSADSITTSDGIRLTSVSHTHSGPEMAPLATPGGGLPAGAGK